MKTKKASQLNYLGVARAREIEKLVHVGSVLVTGAMVDVFGQMTVSECQAFVKSIYAWLPTAERPTNRLEQELAGFLTRFNKQGLDAKPACFLPKTAYSRHTAKKSPSVRKAA